MNKAQLVQAVLHLPRHDRAEIAAAVLRSLDDELPGDDVGIEEWEQAWGVEVTRRIEELERGDAKTVPAEVVFEDIRARLAERKGEG